MNNHIEGTIVLDGMIEGRLPADAKAAESVRKWVDFAASANLRFSYDGDGGSFSILADNHPIVVNKLGPDRTEVVTSALKELLKAFSPPERARLFSTLRSAEYGKGREIQTVYVLTAAGDVEAKQRTVEAETVAPPVAMATKEKMRVGAKAGLAVLIAFGVSLFFVDYRSVFRNMRAQVAAIKPEDVTVEWPGFERYFTIDQKRVTANGDALILTLRRTGEFPKTDLDVNTAATRRATTEVAEPLTARMALEAVGGGYLHCESFEDHGAFIDTRQVRIRELRNRETVDVAVPLSRDPRTARVVITY